MEMRLQGMILSQRSYVGKRGERFNITLLDSSNGSQFQVSSAVKVAEQFVCVPAAFVITAEVRSWSKDGRSGMVFEASSIDGQILTKKGGEK